MSMCVCVSIVCRGLRVRAGVTPRQRLHRRYLLPAARRGKTHKATFALLADVAYAQCEPCKAYDAINAGEKGREIRYDRYGRVWFKKRGYGIC